MTKKEVTSLIGVIAKVKDIAERDYSGMIYDNILAIFNKLGTKEKRVLLKGLINICFVVEDKVLVSTSDLLEVKEAVLKTKNKVEALPSIEEANKIELARQLVKLKTLIVKAFLLTMLTALVCLLVFAPKDGVVYTAIKNVSEIYDSLKSFFE